MDAASHFPKDDPMFANEEQRMRNAAPVHMKRAGQMCAHISVLSIFGKCRLDTTQSGYSEKNIIEVWNVSL